MSERGPVNGSAETHDHSHEPAAEPRVLIFYDYA